MEDRLGREILQQFGSYCTAFVSVLTLSLLIALPAQAYPGSGFTSGLKSVETSTTEAGTDTEVNIVIEHTMNQCLDQPVKPEECTNLYEEQNIKDMDVDLPYGMFANRDAAPYCDEVKVPVLIPDVNKYGDQWLCTNPNAIIGYTVLEATACSPEEYPQDFSGCYTEGFNDFTPFDIPLEPGASSVSSGYIYNARPREGQQARLVAIVPELNYQPNQGGWLTIEMGITVDASDPSKLHLHSESRDIPDLLPLWGIERRGRSFWMETEIYRMTLVLGGMPPAPQGEQPLERTAGFIDSPRLCEDQEFSSEMTGWANNGEVSHSPYAPIFSSGVGLTNSSTFPYQATECDSLEYKPELTISEDTSQAKAKPAISSTIRQGDSEATTKSVEIKLPDFGLNSQTQATSCTESQLSLCPDTSVVGNAEAESPYIPQSEEKLSGNVYLTGTNSDGSLNLAIDLNKGFIPMVLKGKARIEDGATFVAFDNLAPVAISSFTTNFKGGDQQGILTNPSSCGRHEIETTFTSHTGKQTSSVNPWEITGCLAQSHLPSFSVQTSGTERGKPFGLSLDVAAGSDASASELIDEVRFVLDRRIKLRTRKLSKRTLGSITGVSSSRGLQEATLKSPAKGARNKAKGVLSLGSKSQPDLGASIFRKNAKRKTLKAFKLKDNRSNRSLKNRTLAQNFVATKLPRSDYSSVLVELNPNGETRLLTMPKRCTKALAFVARVKTKDGRKHFLKQSIKPGCRKERKAHK